MNKHKYIIYLLFGTEEDILLGTSPNGKWQDQPTGCPSATLQGADI